jgi:hypothetical protein
MQEHFALCPVEIEVPGGVREHFLPGIESEHLSTRFIAIYDATVGSCQDRAGNMFVKQ